MSSINYHDETPALITQRSTEHASRTVVFVTPPKHTLITRRTFVFEYVHRRARVHMCSSVSASMLLTGSRSILPLSHTGSLSRTRRCARAHLDWIRNLSQMFSSAKQARLPGTTNKTLVSSADKNNQSVCLQ